LRAKALRQVPDTNLPLKGGFAVAYGDALRAPLTVSLLPGLGSASGLSRIRRFAPDTA
jgi:hypothetical protein